MNDKTLTWISKEQILFLHQELINRYGGVMGIRDEALLDSALARPQIHRAYGQKDIYQLAAIYAIGLIRNHAFLDGNKRIAYSVAGLFLYDHGVHLAVLDAQRHISLFEKLAANEISQTELAEFYAINSTIE